MSRFPETVRPDAPVQEAAARMRAFEVGFLPVVEDREVVGVVTDRDLVIRVLLLPGGSLRFPVSLIMTRDVVCCEGRTSISIVVRTLSALKIRRMPVLERDGKILGVIGLEDLVKAGYSTPAALILDTLCRPIPFVPRWIPEL